MNRSLVDHDEVRERSEPLRHPVSTKPELLVQSLDQVWSWEPSGDPIRRCHDLVAKQQGFPEVSNV